MNDYFTNKFIKFSQFKQKYTENEQTKMDFFENNIDNRVDLQSFKLMKEILKKEAVFSNNKILTFSEIVGKLQENMKQNKEKFQNDEN